MPRISETVPDSLMKPHAFALSLCCGALLALGACDTHGSEPRAGGPAEVDPDDFVWPPPVPDPTDDRDAHCRALDETACVEDPGCRVRYRSSSCDRDGMCTEDELFHYCAAAPIGVAEATEARRVVCGDTGGTWRQENPIEHSTCNCTAVAARTPIQDGIVIETWLGCASLRQLCEAQGHEWRRIENTRVYELARDVSESECVDSHRHTATYDASSRRCTIEVNGFTCFIDGEPIWDENRLHRRPL